MTQTTTTGPQGDRAPAQGGPLAPDRIVSEDDAGSAAIAEEARAERGDGPAAAASPAGPADGTPAPGDGPPADTTPDEDPSAQRQGHVEAGMRS